MINGLVFNFASVPEISDSYVSMKIFYFADVLREK